MKKSCSDEASSRIEETKSKASDYFKSGLCRQNKALSCSDGCDIRPLVTSALSGTDVHNKDVNVMANIASGATIVGGYKSSISISHGDFNIITNGNDLNGSKSSIIVDGNKSIISNSDGSINIITNGNDLNGSEGSIISAFSGTDVHNNGINVISNNAINSPIIGAIKSNLSNNTIIFN